jgi:hypothetical protein
MVMRNMPRIAARAKASDQRRYLSHVHRGADGGGFRSVIVNIGAVWEGSPCAASVN